MTSSESGEGQVEDPPVLCMECKRWPATITRGKARWCEGCIGWLERRKEHDDGLARMQGRRPASGGEESDDETDEAED